MKDFKIVDNKYLLKSLTLGKELIQVRIMINQSDFNVPENINGDIVAGIIDLVVAEPIYHTAKATKFINFLVENCGLYERDAIDKIQGFRLTSIEIDDCFGKHMMTMYSKYRLQFDFISEFHVDTYGFFYVTFMNKHVIGVQRVQS